MKLKQITKRMLSLSLAATLVSSALSGCSSKHLEGHYEENNNSNIVDWDNVDNDNVADWDDNIVSTWNDVDDYSDWVYSQLLFDNISTEYPIVECEVLDYKSNGEYFDGDRVYELVGDKFDVNSFVVKYAVGTGVIVVCVVLTAVTAGADTPIVCFIAGAADGAVSGAIKGQAFGAAMGAVTEAIRSGGDFEETLYGTLEGSADGYMWGAIFGAIEGGWNSKYCFTADTMLLTDKGYQPISSITVGDMVYSYDTETAAYNYKSVTQLNVNNTSELAKVTINGETITSTPSHPYLTENGWLSAGELKTGMRIFSADNTYKTVEQAEIYFPSEPVPTYNICVSDYHTYIVGENEIVVHNNCKLNEEYADKTKYFDEGTEQAKKYPKGVYFKETGYPDYTPYAKAIVKFDLPSLEGKSAGTCLTGNCYNDFKLANARAGFKETPAGWTWHHCEDMQTMMLVPQDLHSPMYGGFAHNGGASLLRAFFKAIT